MIKRIYASLFGLYRENARLVVKVLGLKLKFQFPGVNQLADVCCIADIESLKNNNVKFPHPVGIVINPSAKIGKNCIIYQNVTIGAGKYSEKYNSCTPLIGENVVIFANSVIIGGICIGKNSVIGAGSVVISDVPEGVVAAGNPARIIRKNL